MLIVIRDFCKRPRVLSWVDSVVQDGVSRKKSVLLDDPGSIALVGYTSGARGCVKAMWAKNLLPKQTSNLQDPKKLQHFDFLCSSTFALFWSMLQTTLPGEVLTDIEKYLGKLGSG